MDITNQAVFDEVTAGLLGALVGMDSMKLMALLNIVVTYDEALRRKMAIMAMVASMGVSDNVAAAAAKIGGAALPEIWSVGKHFNMTAFAAIGHAIFTFPVERMTNATESYLTAYRKTIGDATNITTFNTSRELPGKPVRSAALAKYCTFVNRDNMREFWPVISRAFGFLFREEIVEVAIRNVMPAPAPQPAPMPAAMPETNAEWEHSGEMDVMQESEFADGPTPMVTGLQAYTEQITGVVGAATTVLAVPGALAGAASAPADERGSGTVRNEPATPTSPPEDNSKVPRWTRPSRGRQEG